MSYIVLVHLKHFDPNRGEFIDLAFKPSSDGSGASIILEECGVAANGSICAHIAEHYAGVGGHPAVFWRFEESDLDNQICKIRQIDSDSGDECHHEVVEKTDGTSRNALKKALRRISKQWSVADLLICDAMAGVRPLTDADVASVYPEYQAGRGEA